MRWTTTHDGHRVPHSVIAKGGPSLMAEFWDGVIAPKYDPDPLVEATFRNSRGELRTEKVRRSELTLGVHLGNGDWEVIDAR